MQEDESISEDKNESEMSQMRLSKRAEGIITELNAMHGKAKDKILELIETLRSDGLKDHQIKKILFERINFISKSELYRVLPQELKREYTKPLPKTINVTTEHKVIEQPYASQYEYKPSEEPVSEKELKYMDKIPEGKEPEYTDSTMERNNKIVEIAQEKEEDPKDLEIQFLKSQIGELHEALKKTNQFTAATKLPATNALPAATTLHDDVVFQYLRDRAKETGNVIVIDRVGSGSGMVQALIQYKTAFNVAELFLRVIE